MNQLYINIQIIELKNKYNETFTNNIFNNFNDGWMCYN